MKQTIYRDVKLSYPDDMDQGEALDTLMYCLYLNKDAVIYSVKIERNGEDIKMISECISRKKFLKPIIDNVKNEKCVICSGPINGECLKMLDIDFNNIYIHKYCYNKALKEQNKPYKIKRMSGSFASNTR